MHDSHMKVSDSSFAKISKTNKASDLENSEQIPKSSSTVVRFIDRKFWRE